MESIRKPIYKKSLKQTACVSLFLLQVTMEPTTGREEKRGGNRYRPPCLRGFLRRRMNPRVASGGGAWRRHAATVPVVLKAFHVITDCFGAIL